MADPKTGELATPEDFEIPADSEELKKAPKDIGYVKTPRDLARDEMARRAQKRRLADEGSFKVDTLEDDGTITPSVQSLPELTTSEQTKEPKEEKEPKEQIKAAEAPSLSEEAPASVPPTAAEQKEEEKELIVDGKRIKVPLSKILDAGTRTLQKETAADMRLAAATELLKSAQERQVVQPVLKQPVTPSDEDAQLARSIQFGTEEEARTAIARLRNASPTITPQQLDAYVQQKLVQALPEHQAFYEANHWLKTEHPEIASDPELKFLFDTREDQARKLGDRRPYSELYKDLAQQISTKFNLKKEKIEPPQPMTTQASDRLTRKAASPRPVTGASGRIQEVEPAKKPLSVAEYVSQQRQRRGLQPLDKQA